MLLLAIGLASYIAGPASTLPACCRRDGQHHCAMMDKATAPPTTDLPQITRAPERCPNRAPTLGRLAPITLGLPRHAAFYANVESHPADSSQVDAVWRVSRFRSDFKRGPPSLL